MRYQRLKDALILVFYLLPYVSFAFILFIIAFTHGKLNFHLEDYEWKVALLFAVIGIIAYILMWWEYDKIETLPESKKQFWNNLYAKTFYLGFFIPLYLYFLELRGENKVKEYLYKYQKLSTLRFNAYLFYSNFIFIFIGFFLSSLIGHQYFLAFLAVFGILYFYIQSVVIIDIIFKENLEAIDTYLSINRPFGLGSYLMDSLKNRKSR